MNCWGFVPSPLPPLSSFLLNCDLQCIIENDSLTRSFHLFLSLAFVVLFCYFMSCMSHYTIYCTAKHLLKMSLRWIYVSVAVIMDNMPVFFSSSLIVLKYKLFYVSCFIVLSEQMWNVCCVLCMLFGRVRCALICHIYIYMYI